MTRVLLIEDDASLGGTLAERLAREKLSVKWVRTVAEARSELAVSAWDLAIVDVTLPDGSGFGLARAIRKDTATPIMFMTALNSAESRLEGFEIGAEEYLPKPFHLKEFLIRVRRLIARQRPRESMTVGRVVLDFDAMSVESPEGTKVFLQVRDNRVLKLLVDAAPRVVNRSEILDRVWGQDRFPTPRAVDNSIVRLRHALGDEHGRVIRSVRGVGYQWAGSGEA
jgi:two-component system, OmpR family, phosphate regulon response regulator PhoB